MPPITTKGSKICGVVGRQAGTSSAQPSSAQQGCRTQQGSEGRAQHSSHRTSQKRPGCTNLTPSLCAHLECVHRREGAQADAQRCSGEGRDAIDVNLQARSMGKGGQRPASAQLGAQRMGRIRVRVRVSAWAREGCAGVASCTCPAAPGHVLARTAAHMAAEARVWAMTYGPWPMSLHARARRTHRHLEDGGEDEAHARGIHAGQREPVQLELAHVRPVGHGLGMAGGGGSRCAQEAA